MKRKCLLLLLMLMLLTLLTACSGEGSSGGKQIFAEATQYLGPAITNTPAPTSPPQQESTSVFSENPYDVDFEAAALGEEGVVDPNETGAYVGDPLFSVGSETTVYPYAGSTPIPLVPVDMPSPTPRSPLKFEYASYTASSLGLTFEAPSGWLADSTLSDVFVLTEPETQMHDGQQATFSFFAVPVNNNYDKSDLKKEVSQRLKSIGSLNFVEWDPSLTAERHLLGATSIYANYSGTLANGIKVGGRIMYACVDNRLYGVEVVYPLEYRDDYLEVYNHIRDTLTRN